MYKNRACYSRRFGTNHAKYTKLKAAITQEYFMYFKKK